MRWVLALLAGGVAVVALGVVAWFLLPPGMRAQAALARGDWAAAEREARAAVKAQPRDPDSIRSLAHSLARQKKAEEAMRLFGRLGSNAMQAEDLMLLGLCLEEVGELKSAAQVLSQAAALEPANPEVAYHLARYDATQDRLAEAMDRLRPLLDDRRWSARAGALQLQVAMKQGDMPAALAAYAKATASDPALKSAVLDPDKARRLAIRAELSVGHSEGALRLLGSAGAASDAETAWLRSRALLQAGRVEEASAALRELESLAQKDPSAARAFDRTEPAEYRAADACVSCHREIYQAQQATRHANTFSQGSRIERFAWPSEPIADSKLPGVTHEYRKEQGGITAHTTSSGQQLQGLVKYVMGSGDRGATPIGLDDQGQWCEFRASSYRAGSLWDVTTGHPPVPPRVQDHLGLPLSADAVRRCQGCHTTKPFLTTNPDHPLAAERGIGCEKCHGPGGNHIIAMEAKWPDLAIAQHSRSSPRAVDRVCADCHSPKGMEIRPDDPTSIRFQGTTLAWSKCYNQSGESLGCISCHSPHHNAVTDHAFYDMKCLACHGEAPAAAMAGDLTRMIEPPAGMKRTPCPVNARSGCVECHMPSIPNVLPHTPFTDHHIRVRSEAGGRTAQAQQRGE
jgi:tetratricopeptide (TPR) repeat protein